MSLTSGLRWSHAAGIAAWLLYAASRKLMFDARVSEPKHNNQSAADDAIELAGRRALIGSWRDGRGQTSTPDAYLDGQIAVDDAHFMEEYVLAFASDPGWTVWPGEFAEIDWPKYRAWAAAHLAGHQLEQRELRRAFWGDPARPGLVVAE